MADSSPPNADELLAHSGWVWALARRMVKDPSTADDLTQQLWLTVLLHPPQSRRNLRGWLSTLLLHFVRRTRRTEQRRLRREQTAASTDQVPAADDVVAHGELERLVVDEVLALQEPHRTTILMHFFEGLSPTEMGRRLDLPAATVRHRLKVALARLRSRLERAPHERRATIIATLTLARRGRRAAPGVGPRTTISLPALLHSAKVQVAAVVVVLIASTLTLWPRRSVDDRGMGPTEKLVSAASPPPSISSVIDEASVRTPLPTPPEERSSPASAWVLDGRLLGTVASIPWSTGLHVKPVQGDSRQTLEARLDADHRFRLDVSSLMTVAAPPKDLDLLADDPNYLPVQVRVSMRDLLGRGIAPEDVPVDVHVQPAAIAVGTVADEDDRPVEGASVAACDPRSGDIVARDTSDANGGFRLRVSGEEEFRIIAVNGDRGTGTRTGGLRPASEVVWLEVGKIEDLGTLTLEQGASIRGRLRDGERPLAGVPISASLMRTGKDLDLGKHHRLKVDDAGVENGSLRATTDANGEFLLTGLASADYLLSIESSGAFLLHQTARAILRRTVTAPAENVAVDVSPPRLTVLCEEVDNTYVDVDHDGMSMGGAVRSGRFTVALAPGMTYEVTLRVGAHLEQRFSIVAPERGEIVRRVELAPKVQAGELAIRLLDPKQQSFQLAAFQVGRKELGIADDYTVEASDGVFRLRDLEPARYQLRITPGACKYVSESFFVPVWDEVDIIPGGTTERSYTVQPGGRLRIAVHDESGAFLPLRCVVHDWQGNPVKVTFADANLSSSSVEMLSPHGPNEVGWALTPGKYTVEVQVDRKTVQTADATIKPLETTTIEMTVPSH